MKMMKFLAICFVLIALIWEANAGKGSRHGKGTDPPKNRDDKKSRDRTGDLKSGEKYKSSLTEFSTLSKLFNKGQAIDKDIQGALLYHGDALPLIRWLKSRDEKAVARYVQGKQNDGTYPEYLLNLFCVHIPATCPGGKKETGDESGPGSKTKENRDRSRTMKRCNQPKCDD